MSSGLGYKVEPSFLWAVVLFTLTFNIMGTGCRNFFQWVGAISPRGTVRRSCMRVQELTAIRLFYTSITFYVFAQDYHSAVAFEGIFTFLSRRATVPMPTASSSL